MVLVDMSSVGDILAIWVCNITVFNESFKISTTNITITIFIFCKEEAIFESLKPLHQNFLKAIFRHVENL